MATNRRTGGEKIDRPENLGNPQMRFGSDAVAEVVRQLDYPYIVLVPGASFRGFHDSIVNYLGNTAPQMVVCLHEEHTVAIAEGYAQVTGKPLAVALHSNVGLMHASMAIFNAWCNRNPMLIFGANGPIDASKRRPWIEWVHTTKDQASMIRNYIKWDDEPQSPHAAVESVLRANQITRTPPQGPVYVCLDGEMQENPIDGDLQIPPVERFAPATPPGVSEEVASDIVAAVRAAKFPVMMIGRVSRDRDEWNLRVELAEKLGLAVFSTLMTPASFPTTHTNHIVPASGERPGAPQKSLLEKADLILSLDWVDLAGYLESCFGEKQTRNPVHAKIIQCSLDSYTANGWVMDHQALPATDISVLARPDDLVAQMLKVAAAGPDRDLPSDVPAHWTGLPPDFEVTPPGEPMTRREMAEVIGEYTRNANVTLTRTPIGWSGAGCYFEDPRDYLGKDGGGAVGSGPGNAVGAALALKDDDRIALAVLGDGDFLMGVSALWTAARMRLPMMIVVANNNSYFNDEMHQERVAIARERPAENRWIGQQLDDPAPDILGFGRAQGFEGEGGITDADQLLEALKRGEEIVRKGGRYIIDAQTGGY